MDAHDQVCTKCHYLQQEGTYIVCLAMIDDALICDLAASQLGALRKTCKDIQFSKHAAVVLVSIFSDC